MKKFIKKNKTQIIILTIVLFLTISFGSKTILTNLINRNPSLSSNNIMTDTSTPGVTRTADESTMNSYKKELINSENGSRYAGRVWTDKTVFATGEDSNYDDVKWENSILSFGNNNDPDEWQVETSDDFLHVFSAITSSQQIIEQYHTPLDIVLVLDLSGSMANSVSNSRSRIEIAADAVNSVLENISNMTDARVGLQFYSSYGSGYAGFQNVLPLGTYKKDGTNNYLTISKSGWGSSASYKVNVKARSKNDNTQINKSISSTGGTATQIGIYQGMELLTKATDVTEEKNGETHYRTPVMILITDGVPTFISNGNWWEPSISSSNNQLGSGNSNAAGLNFATMLTAAYMKKAVNQHYYGDEKGKNGQSAKIFTISVDADNADKDVMGSTLNPKEYWDTESTMSKQLKSYWNQYATNTNSTFTIDVCGNSTQSNCRTNKNYTVKHPTNTDNISDLSEEDMKFNDAFYDVASTDLDGIFTEIMDSVTGEIFNPVAGTNSAGVSNSVTFADPIGLYMEVKNKAIAVNNPVDNSENVTGNHGIYDMALLLYNEMHGVVKTAVYDAAFIKEKGEDFKEGWYSKDGEYKGKENTNCSWENGDTYYVPKEIAIEYVPTISKDTTSEEDEDLEHIIYNLYRFAEPSEQRNATRTNPNYGSASGMTFKLSDIRIWVEESDNYIDQSGMEIPGSEYDAMLYINIPSNALPVQVAKITLDDEEQITSYDTNINNVKQAMPLRLFYSIGIKDEILTEDELDIDITKVSQEYIKKNKDTNGNLKFLSNYWSNSTYNNYNNKENKSRGDAVLSFSPNDNNRYYVFQDNYTLYTNAYYIDSQGDIKPIKNIEDYITKPLSKIYEGTSENDQLPENIKQSIQNDINSKKISTDSIVILSGDVIKEENQYNENNKYYIIDTYYVPTEDGKGKKVNIVIERTGLELGLGILGGSKKSTDYLCWKDDKGHQTEVHNYNEKPTSEADDEKWVLSVKKGTLRVGNLSDNIGNKTNNKTQTSSNYYIPTITTQDDSAIVINNYLGNNGRLEVADTLLMITKELDGIIETNEDNQFNFEVSIDGKEGEYQGIILKKHESEYGTHWDYIIEEVEVVVGTNGFILKPDGSFATTTYQNEEVYIKVSQEYSENLSVKATEDDDENDNQRFYVNVDYYKSTENSQKINSNPEKLYVWETSIGESHNGSENTLGDKYQTSSTYKTKILKFGYSTKTKKELEENNSYPESWTDEDKKLQTNTAIITLAPDEGILINGISSGADYKVTEIIGIKQNLDGINFKKVVQKMNNSTVSYDYESHNTTTTPGNGANGYQKEENGESEKKYTVFGDTGNNIEEIHFTNYDKLKHLTISKNLEPEDGTTITDHDKNTKFTFTISFDDLEGNPLVAKINYVILDKDLKYDEETLKDKIQELTLTGTENEIFTFELKANEKIIFDNLPLKTGYKYELIEKETDGYISQNKKIDGVVEAESDGVMPQTVENIKLLPKTDVNLNGTKTLIGDTLKANTFEFTITPNTSNPKDDPIKETTIKNDEDGNIPFINTEYNYPGTYEYTIKEKNTNTEGVIYDSTEYNVKVTISEDSNYKLQKNIEITTAEGKVDNIKFTNIFVNKPITLNGTKILVNGTLTDEQFTYTITPDKSNPENDIISSKTTVTNQSDGQIEILNGVYKNLGTYKYHISETIPDDTGTIIYDTTEYDIIVTIKVTNDNTITSDIEITSNNATKQAVIFRNINVNEKVELNGYKHLTGGELTDNQFSFTITPDSNNPDDDPIKTQDIINDEKGIIPLINATYTKTGTYKYHINEKINNSTNNIEYDTTTYDVTVEIKLNNGNTTHEITILNNEQKVANVEFTNYVVDEKVILNGTKYLENGSLKNQEFSFIIAPSSSNPENDIIKSPTIVKNDANGNIEFINAEYTHKGTYKYQIKEVIPENQKNIIYDPTIYDVTINIDIENDKVTKEIDIKVNGETRRTISFNNILQSIDFKLEGIKNLIGRDLKDQEFSFIITPDLKNPESDIIKEETIVKNSSTGNIELLNGTYKELGTYKYHIKEDIPTTTNNILYDTTEYDVIVTLSAKDNQIDKEVLITNNNQSTDYINFTNIVRDIKVQVNGQKKLVGGKLKDSEFKFLIISDKSNPENDPIKEEIISVNDIDGKIPIINNNYIAPGIYKYQVYEIKEENNRIINYDQSIYEITVTIFEEDSGLLTSNTSISKNNEITEEIIFTNSIIDSIPNTYDNIINYIILLISTIFTSLLALFINQRLKKD